MATADTDTWLEHPARWDHNGGDGPFSDKVLARLAFTAGLAAAVRAARANDGKPALVAAARRLAQDQAKDGSWQVEAAGPIGTPATYGPSLATWLAADSLRQADPVEFAPSIRRAQTWLSRVEPVNASGAAAVLLAAGDDPPPPESSTTAALAWFREAQGPDGGWGPYRAAPPEVFDTALGLLALARFADRPGVPDQIKQARAFLITTQEPDGHWTETTRPSGGESYAQRLSTTGWATLALLNTNPPQAARDMQPIPATVNPAHAAGPSSSLPSENLMADPRNIAHDKKVQQEKKHHDEPIAPENAAVAPQPGKKTPTVHEKSTEEPVSTHATSQHHKDKTTGHVEEPTEVKAEADAAAAAEGE